MRKYRQIGVVALAVLWMLLVLAACTNCSGVQSVKPYEIGKVTAEALLFDARILQNKGTITSAQFDQVRSVYDQLRIAQDIAINARKALITYNTAQNQAKAQAAMDGVLKLSGELVTLAQSFGLLKEVR